MGAGNGKMIKADVIWIDPEIYNDENTKFVKELNSLYSINIKLFKKSAKL